MGLSFSKIIWRLLNGMLLDKENLRKGRYEIRNNSRFILRYLYESDIGRYFCEVQSVLGFDIEFSVVIVNNKLVRILVEYVVGNFIIILWNGIRNQWFMIGYEIYYKLLDNLEKF